MIYWSAISVFQKKTKIWHLKKNNVYDFCITLLQQFLASGINYLMTTWIVRRIFTPSFPCCRIPWDCKLEKNHVGMTWAISIWRKFQGTEVFGSKKREVMLKKWNDEAFWILRSFLTCEIFMKSTAISWKKSSENCSQIHDVSYAQK